MGTRVDLYEAIRRNTRRKESRSGRWRSATGCTGDGVWAALASAVPAPRKVPVRVAPKLEAARLLIDAMLIEDLTAWPK